MGEMIDKVFSTKLAEQMTGFYGKQKMLRKLNNKLEMNNQQQKVVELDHLIDSYADKVALSEDGLYEDCDEYGDCPLMTDERVLSRMEEVLADAYEAQDEQGSYDPWSGTRDFLEFGEAREDAYYDQYDQDALTRDLEDELKYKERELALAKRTAERERKKRQYAEDRQQFGTDGYDYEDQPYPYEAAPSQAVRPPQQPRAHPVQSQEWTQQQQPIVRHQHQTYEQPYSTNDDYYSPQEQLPKGERYEIHHTSMAPESHQLPHQAQLQHPPQPPPQQHHHRMQQPPEPQQQPIIQQHMYQPPQQQQQQQQQMAPQRPLPPQRPQQHIQQPQPFIHAEVSRHEPTTHHHYHQHQPPQHADQNFGGGRYDRYADSLRQKSWEEIQDEREIRHAREKNLFTRKSANRGGAAASNQPSPASMNSAGLGAVDLLEDTDDGYGAWTDLTGSSQQNSSFYEPQRPRYKKKTGAMRWLAPDWSIVRWVKNIINDEEYEGENQYHQDSQSYHNVNGVPSEIGSEVMPPELSNQDQPAHAIVISSIFSALVTLFGLYLCMKIMLPSNRFERNSSLTVFYLAAFSFLIVSLMPFDSGADSEVVFNFHKKWDHHPQSIVGVCTEIFRLAVIMYHLSSITNLFLLNLNRKFRSIEKVQKWASLLREFNIVGTFVCLAFLIPLRQDFDWLFSLVIPYIISVIFLLSMKPDSKLELVLNIVILILAYLQLTTLFILSVFILNFKVFQFGYKKTKYIKTSASSAESIAWAKQEFQDATSYLNTTLECTSDGDAFVTERAIKRAIRSYGIVSIMEERIEYVGATNQQHSGESSSDATTDVSFILFDASKEESLMKGSSDLSAAERKPVSAQGLPVIEKSELGRPKQRGQRDVLSEERRPNAAAQRGGATTSGGEDHRGRIRRRSRSPNKIAADSSPPRPPARASRRQNNQIVEEGTVSRSQPQHYGGVGAQQKAYFSNAPAAQNLAMLMNDSSHDGLQQPPQQRHPRQQQQQYQSQLNLMSPITAESSPLQQTGQFISESYMPPQPQQTMRQSQPLRNQQRASPANSFSPTTSSQQNYNRPMRAGLAQHDETRYMSQQPSDGLSDNIGGQNNGVANLGGATAGNLSSSNLYGADDKDTDLFFDCTGRTAGGLSDNTSGIMLQVPGSPSRATTNGFGGGQFDNQAQQRPGENFTLNFQQR